MIAKVRTRLCLALGKCRCNGSPSVVEVDLIAALIQQDQVGESVVVVVADKNLFNVFAYPLRQSKFYFCTV